MKRILPSFCFLFCAFIIAQAQVTPNFIYSPTCYNNPTTLVASSSLPDTSISMWQWDLDGNGTYEMSGKTIISSFTMNDTNAVMLKITPNVGAADSITKNVIIDPLPNVNFMANNLCELKAATYISLSTISSGSINQYLWDFDNDNVTDDNFSGDTAMYTCGPAQTYMTKLICVSDKGCSAFTQKVTTVYPNPTAAFTAPSSACVNANAAFINTSTISNLDFYLWNFGDGNASSQTNPSHIYSAAGTYTVDLIVASQAGCRDTASFTVMINPLPTAAIIGNNNICAGISTNLSASGGASYLWNTSAVSASITVSPASTTSYSVTVTDVNGCSDIASVSVMVNPLPVVSITPSSSVLPNGGTVTMIANGADYYLWNTGSNAISITTDSIGTYIVTGTDMNGCTSSDSMMIARVNTDSITISSIIMTPNGDGINDVLKINNISAYTNCDLKVYNMWNDLVFSATGYKNDWGGYGNNGKQIPDGPYYYIIACDDKPMVKGNINIILR